MGCTNAGKRTEEGFRVFTEDELKLNKGGGMCDFCSDDRYTIVPIWLWLLYVIMYLCQAFDKNYLAGLGTPHNRLQILAQFNHLSTECQYICLTLLFSTNVWKHDQWQACIVHLTMRLIHWINHLFGRVSLHQNELIFKKKIGIFICIVIAHGSRELCPFPRFSVYIYMLQPFVE